MSWQTAYAGPVAVPRAKEVPRAYDAEHDISNRSDSVFDAYADIFANYGDDDGSSPVPSPIAQQLHSPEPEVQQRKPWDTRGKTGLYGGGGRGADDRETGWVSNYAVVKKEQNHQGGGVEEDIRHVELPQHRRRSSSGSGRSSSGPITPPSAAYEGLPSQREMQDSYKKPTSLRQARPKRMEPAYQRTIDYGTGHYAVPDHAPLRHELPPATSYRDVGPYSGNPDVPPTSQTKALRRKKSKGGNAKPQPTISEPKALPPPIDGAPSAPAVPRLTRPKLGNAADPDDGRRKSFAASLKWNKSKKPPVISLPILPDGFVESLGMETFALTPGCAAPAHNGIPSRKTAPRPRKIPPQPMTGSNALSIQRQPELVRTPLDALRDVGASAPVVDFRGDTLITPAGRGHSRDSSYSSTPSTIAPHADKDRQQYSHGVRDDSPRSRDHQTPHRPSPPPTQNAAASSYNQFRRGSAATMQQSHYSQPSSSGRRSSSYGLDYPASSNAPSPPPLPTSSHYQSVERPQTEHRPSVDSTDSTSTTGSSNYLDGYGSAVERSPADNESDHSNFSLDDRVFDDGGNESDYSQASPSLAQSQQTQYSSFQNVFKGYGSGWPSAATETTKAQSDDVPPHAGGFSKVDWNAKPKSAPTKPRTRTPTPPAPTPAFVAQPSAFESMGESLFRNPFQAAASTGPRKTGWQ